jgi:hypothetical protein
VLGGGVIVNGGVGEVSTVTVATGVETVPEPPLEEASEVLTSMLASAWATGVETSAEAAVPSVPAVTLVSALAAGVDASTDAWAPPDVSTFALVSALATGAFVVVLASALGVVVESLTLAAAVLGPAVTVVFAVAEEDDTEALVSTETCVDGSDGGVDNAAAVPPYASAASTASTATPAIRRALLPICRVSFSLDPLEI